ncbi:sigma factor [Roseibium salinum]|nr:sigma factor [Roseibium salinum]
MSFRSYGNHDRPPGTTHRACQPDTGGARDRAEDVVQDAMLKACAARRGLCPDCPKRFACRMVRNLAIDTLRRKELENRACSRIVKDNLVDTVQADSHAQLESSQLIAVLAGTPGCASRKNQERLCPSPA